jgi:hypothetical protein
MQLIRNLYDHFYEAEGLFLAGKKGQGDGHDQAAACSVGSRHAAAMETNGPFGNGQADAGAAALSITGLGHPEKGFEEMMQAPFRGPGPVVPHRDDGQPRFPFRGVTQDISTSVFSRV